MGNAPWNRRLGCVLGVAFGVAAVAQDGAAIVREGPHFVVEMLPDGIAAEVAVMLADQALIAAESGWAPLAKLIPIRLTTKPTVVVHGRVESLLAVDLGVRKLPFPIDDFGVFDGTKAHVRVVPVLADDVMLRTGLPEMTRQSVLRWAVEVAVMQYSAAARQDPWLAEIVAFGILDASVAPAGDTGVDPLLDGRRGIHYIWTQQGVDDDLIRRIGQNLAPKDRGDFDQRWQASALLANWMAHGGASWGRKLLAKPSRSESVVGNRLTVFDKILGKDRRKAQAKWLAFLHALVPKWCAYGHVVPKAGGFEVAGSRDVNAFLGAMQVPPAGHYELHARCCLAAAGTPSLQVELDREQDSAVAVVVSPGSCAVSLCTDGKWSKAVAEAAAAVAVDVPFDLVCEVTSTLRVRIDGAEVVNVPCGDRTMHGDWRLVVGSALLTVDGLEVVPLPAKK